VINGMLWPQGKIQYGTGSKEEQESWTRFARLLKAGIAGVKSGLGPAQHVKIMIHIDRGADWPRTKYFFDHLQQEQVEFDIIGQSYYPWWHGSFQDLKKNLAQTANRYQKPIVVVETGYPHRGPTWKDRPNMTWPISPAGQAQFLQDVVQATLQTPHGLGAGVLYWYPEAIPVDGLQIWEGGSIGLFDESGNSLPALQLFSKGVPITSSLKEGIKR
jgi:arabinogalactan endo-1,4-beta-galactosidase